MFLGWAAAEASTIEDSLKHYHHFCSSVIFWFPHTIATILKFLDTVGKINPSPKSSLNSGIKLIIANTVSRAEFVLHHCRAYVYYIGDFFISVCAGRLVILGGVRFIHTHHERRQSVEPESAEEHTKEKSDNAARPFTASAHTPNYTSCQ